MDANVLQSCKTKVRTAVSSEIRVLNLLNVLSGNSGEAEISETLMARTEIFYHFLTSHRPGRCFITLKP